MGFICKNVDFWGGGFGIKVYKIEFLIKSKILIIKYILL